MVRIPIFVLVLVSGCCTSRCVKYEVKESVNVKEEISTEKTTVTTEVDFSQTW